MKGLEAKFYDNTGNKLNLLQEKVYGMTEKVLQEIKHELGSEE